MSYCVEPLEDDRREHMMRVWKENFSDPEIARVANERFRWLYEESPTGRPFTVLALAGATREVVGCGSTYARRMWIRGHGVKVGIAVDFAVSKRHRIGGASIAIQRALIERSREHDLSCVIGFPNPRALKILERVGYQVICSASAWVKPLRTVRRLATRLRRPRIARVVAVVVDKALAAIDGALSAFPRGLISEFTERPDERFDALWVEARDRYGIVGEKTRAFLDWRYAGFHSVKYRFFMLRGERTGRLKGWVVYHVKDGAVLLEDMFALDMRRTSDLVLLHFARAMRAQGHSSIFITYAGKAAFTRRLARLGFFRGTHQRRSLVGWVGAISDADWQRTVLDPENWSMFSGELDI